MKTKRINGSKAKEVLAGVGSVYHLGAFETGKRVNMSRVKNLIDNDLAAETDCISLYTVNF